MSDAPEGRLAQSVRWQTLNVGFQVLFQLAFIKALSIFLSEAEWGIIGIALGIIGIIEIFAQLGVGPSLIQRKTLTEAQVSAAFWVSLLLGLLFGLTTFFTAPLIAQFYHRADLIPLLRFIALSFPLAGLALVPRAMLIRKMDFRNLFWSSLIAMPIGNGLIGILAAYNGWGVYAYAGALLAQNALLGLNYWFRAGVRIHKPAFAPAQPLFKYGASSTVFNFLNYAASRLDVLVLGRFLPESRNADQGIYDRSNYMMTLPITLLGKLSDSVLFSSMSEVQENRERLRNIFLGGLYFTACLVFPGVVLLAGFIKIRLFHTLTSFTFNINHSISFTGNTTYSSSFTWFIKIRYSISTLTFFVFDINHCIGFTRRTTYSSSFTRFIKIRLRFPTLTY